MALTLLAAPLACGDTFIAISGTGGSAGTSGTGGSAGTSGTGGEGAVGGTGGVSGGGGTSQGGGGSGGQGGGQPANCDPFDGPIDPGCGVYVAGSGNDNADGSQANPFQTIEHAIEVIPEGGRIYVCGQTFYRTQPLVVSKRVEMYGALDCATDWARHDYPKTILTGDPGVVPLQLEPAAAGSEFHDVDSRAVDAATAGGSSIAVVISGATNVSFARCTLAAGTGANGADPTVISPAASGVPGGNGGVGCTANAAPGGPHGYRNCAPDTSTGGLGGAGGDLTGNPGTAGSSSPPVQPPVPNAGKGATDSGEPCTQGLDGAIGAVGANAGPAQGPVALDGAGIHPLPGGPGAAGDPGQGGGGGGGSNSSLCVAAGVVGPGGGGGGSGGCGGAGGPGGQAGGSSIAVVLLGGATVSFDLGVDIIVHDAGRGGAGADGQLGGPGALGGLGGSTDNGNVHGCAGGQGGPGGQGGGGSGGQGGYSIGVAFLLGEPGPTMNNVIPILGAEGVGGPGGLGNAGNAAHGASGLAAGTMAF